MTKLSPEAAFLHVTDAHRWLSVSGCSWNLLTANEGKNIVRRCADVLLPDVIVAVRDCALLHARSLIDFYTKPRPPAKHTDILLCDFNGLSIEPILKDALQVYKNSIEVHLFHLTAWRDWDYREQYASGENEIKKRPNWDKQIAPLVGSILNALKCASEKSSQWKKPFTNLHEASIARYQDETFQWPSTIN